MIVPVRFRSYPACVYRSLACRHLAGGVVGLLMTGFNAHAGLGHVAPMGMLGAGVVGSRGARSLAVSKQGADVG